jgi:hypothetical protein
MTKTKIMLCLPVEAKHALDATTVANLVTSLRIALLR